MSIRWPSGQVTELQDIQANQILVIKEGAGIIGTIESKPRAKAIEPEGKLPSTWGRLKEDKLYQNYPNPFNPDTWIPYQLQEDSDVVIKIYTSAGRLVRTLNLGHKSAGIYTRKEKAAYWDGKNEEGERTASGVYFYNIQAGDFTATKKMAIVE